MKSLKKLIVLAICLHLSVTTAFAENEYSPRAIQAYNIAATYQNQGKYELAEKQYKMVLSLQPDFKEAKNNLAALYYNLAIQAYSKPDYFNAISYARKSLQTKSNDVEMYSMIGNSYLNLKRNDDAITAYKKVLSLDSNNVDIMHSLAQIYLVEQQYTKAVPLYRKLLAIDPNDTAAQQNSKYIASKLQDSNLDSSLNNLTVSEKAPTGVYNLIKPSRGVPSDAVEHTKTMLDLIWGDPTGKMLLTNLVQSKISINLTTQGVFDANATQTNKQNTLYLYGCLPVLTTKKSSVSVNIPFTYVENFANPNISSYQRIYSLHALVHEFCHAYRDIKFPSCNNSIEEELGASMIGLNVSFKVITGEYLSHSQTETHSMQVLQALLNDSHKNLPIYSGFQKNMQSLGIIIPYPEIYSNPPQMYKTLLSEGKISPISSFSIYDD